MREGRRPSPRAWALGFSAALLALAYAINLMAVAYGMATPIAVDGSGGVATSVAPGSFAWVLGVRQGSTAAPPQAPDFAFTITQGDGLEIGIPARVDVSEPDTAILMVGLLALGIALRIAGVPGSSLAFGLSAAVALAPFATVLGYPTALPLAAIPPAVTLLDTVGSSPGLGRGWLTLLSAVFLLSVAVPVAAFLTPTNAWPWDLVWKTPAIAVVAIGLVGAGPALSGAFNGGGSWSDRVGRLLAETFPVARSSRLAGSASERRALAAEMHDRVLPQLGQAILEIDASDPAGRARLSAVVEQIRRSMSERQVTTLEHGGFMAAVDGYVASLGIPLEVQAENPSTGRAPQRVERAAYRVAQLAIANAVQHASADKIKVEVVESERELSLIVSDNGIGIDESAERNALATGHIGLADMRAEAREVSAILDVRSEQNQGTRIQFLWKS